MLVETGFSGRNPLGYAPADKCLPSEHMRLSSKCLALLILGYLQSDQIGSMLGARITRFYGRRTTVTVG